MLKSPKPKWKFTMLDKWKWQNNDWSWSPTVRPIQNWFKLNSAGRDQNKHMLAQCALRAKKWIDGPRSPFSSPDQCRRILTNSSPCEAVNSRYLLSGLIAISFGQKRPKRLYDWENLLFCTTFRQTSQKLASPWIYPEADSLPGGRWSEAMLWFFMGKSRF